MDLSFSPAEQAFREEVRAFLASALPEHLSAKVRRREPLSKNEYEQWHHVLAARGWLAPNWPVEWGGAGWSVMQRHIFEVEIAAAAAPKVIPFGVNMLGPVLLRFGTEAQKRHWLPRILASQDWWCQGYSEPGAGSDLAALRTSAVRDGGHYVVTGQKTWTTQAQHANMMFCLVRTDTQAKPQQGISFLLLDMNAPGVEVRPIRLLDGECEVNDVFLNEVRVPIANLVGAENEGWTCAKYLLTYERSSIASVGSSMADLAELKRIAARPGRGGRRLIDDPLFAIRVARAEIELENLRITNLRMLSATAAGGAPAAESSILKIRGSELRQEISALLRRALGPAARIAPESSTLPEPRLTQHYLNSRKLSIFGGSNEVQREVIAKHVLGM